MQLNPIELDKMLRSVFDAGENWGRCYSGWFQPSEEQKEEWYQDALKNLVSESKDICENCEPVGNPQCKNCIGC
jgi:hypothetical protein